MFDLSPLPLFRVALKRFIDVCGLHSCNLLKFVGQHANKWNFCLKDDLCPNTKKVDRSNLIFSYGKSIRNIQENTDIF